ncbi:MoaF C-terminal domain-containing protein [Pseudonocardia acaciae]|uniref:MoaF C-terminal domain-containing protein n=1 Tax=Pseudonocardia acaciae TaxID=551276 RepID=UPI000491CB1F|nr:MoaF C-terminal domain-containing protein [Pseudonocardia acaciae]
MANPPDWKTLEELAYGIDTNRLPLTQDLVGRELSVTLTDGTGLTLNFTGGDTVSWSDGELADADRYEAVRVDTHTYFVEVWFHARERVSLTLIANMGSRRALAVFSTVAEVPTEGEPQVGQRFVPGVIEDPSAPPTGPEPAPTRDLLGKRILNDYSPNHLYEHIYVNSNRYCWQCLKGVQQGHGDCDLASYYKFDENRYVFAFREFRIPVATVFFFNMDDMRSTGKFFGIASSGRIENNWGGAFISVLSETRYPDGVRPV